jgi:hypothetical protein
MFGLSSFPRWLTLGDRRSEDQAKLRGKRPMPDSDLFDGVESLSKSHKVNANRRVEELCLIAAVGTRPPIQVP